MSAGACERCDGREFQNLQSHQHNAHPSMFYLRPTDPKPHPMAEKVTLYDESPGHTFDWYTARYGLRQHGWFIPVDVPDGAEAAES